MQGENEGRDSARRISRRGLLKGVGTAGTVFAGAAVTTQPATAGDSGDKSGDCDVEEDPTAVYTADHIDTDWMGSVQLVDGHAKTEYDRIGTPFPDNPDELVIHCHGWQNGSECGKRRVKLTKEAYEKEGYDGAVSGLVWDSSYAWWNAKDIADKNAPKLAQFLVDFKEDNPDTTVRLQGHSLGARVVAETLLELDQREEYNILTSAIFLAGAIENDSVAMDGRYGPAIERVVQHAENFWMEDDTILDWTFTTYEFSRAIGNDGCDGEPPANYTDHEKQLDDHSNQYKPDVGVIPEVIETFEEETETENTPEEDENATDSRDDDYGVPGMTLPAVGLGLGAGALLARAWDRFGQ